MSKSSAPTPTNPYQTAGAQTASNVSTALANAFLNNINQTTPLGSLTYDQTGSYQFTDPTNGATYDIPRFTAKQTLSQSQQNIQDQTEAAKYNLASIGRQQSGQLYNLLGTPFNPLSSAPGAGDPNNLLAYGNQQFQIGDAPPLQYGWGDSGNIQKQIQGGDKPITQDYGPADNFSADRARVEDALYGRLNPQLAIEQQRTAQSLADQGIQAGSAAYTNAMDVYNRQANDARLAVTQTAGQEQERMQDMAAKRAGFQNAAQLQDFQEAQQRGAFANQAQQQQYAQDLARTQFYNQAQQQGFGQSQARAQFYNQAQQAMTSQMAAYNAARNQARQQYIQEQYGLRNQPINEVTALLSGSQVSQPTFTQTQQTQIPTTDIASLINQNFNQQFQNYQAQQNQQNAIIGGLFGLGAGALSGGRLFSDRRGKENIHRVGTVFASTKHAVAEPEGEVKKLPFYSYTYKGDPTSTQHIGPMAQDVEQIDPAAVSTHKGMKYIKPARVMGSILRAAAA